MEMSALFNLHLELSKGALKGKPCHNINSILGLLIIFVSLTHLTLVRLSICADYLLGFFRVFFR